MADEVEMAERMAKVETWQKGHEQLCAERWGLLMKLIGWGGGLAFVTTLAVAGWSLNRIYEGQQHQAAVLEQLVNARR